MTAVETNTEPRRAPWTVGRFAATLAGALIAGGAVLQGFIWLFERYDTEMVANLVGVIGFLVIGVTLLWWANAANRS